MNWVREVLQRYNLGKEFDRYRVLSLWATVAGEQIGRLTEAVHFRSGRLTVAVSSPSVAQELSFLRERYVARINELFGEEVVKEIRFVPGKIAASRRIPRVPLSPAHQAEAQALFRGLPNRELQRSFEHLYLTLRQREESLIAAGGKRCPRCGVVFFGEGELCPGCRFDPVAGGKHEG